MLGVLPIETYEAGHRSYALVEAMFAVPESAAVTSTEEQDHVKQINDRNKGQLDKLRKGELLSFLDLPDEQRNVPAGKIGSIWKAGPGGARSFHFPRSFRGRTSSTRTRKAPPRRSSTCRNPAGWFTRTGKTSISPRAAFSRSPGQAAREASDRHTASRLRGGAGRGCSSRR